MFEITALNFLEAGKLFDFFFIFDGNIQNIYHKYLTIDLWILFIFFAY